MRVVSMGRGPTRGWRSWPNGSRRAPKGPKGFRGVTFLIAQATGDYGSFRLRDFREGAEAASTTRNSGSSSTRFRPHRAIAYRLCAPDSIVGRQIEQRRQGVPPLARLVRVWHLRKGTQQAPPKRLLLHAPELYILPVNNQKSRSVLCETVDDRQV